MSKVFDLTLFGSVIVTLLVIMNPIGAVPIFLALTRSLTYKQRVQSALRAALVALGVIAAFAVFGQQILSYLHISLPALQGAGGLLPTSRGDDAGGSTAEGLGGFLAVGAGLVAALAIVWLSLRYAGQVHRLLRDSGTMLVTRIAGLLLSAIAVQMIADSVRAFVTTAS